MTTVIEALARDDRPPVFVCDFTPVEYEAYFDEMLSSVSRRGIVICSQFSPVVGLLKGGKYDAVRRDLRSGRRSVYWYLRDHLDRAAVEETLGVLFKHQDDATTVRTQWLDQILEGLGALEQEGRPWNQDIVTRAAERLHARR